MGGHTIGDWHSIGSIHTPRASTDCGPALVIGLDAPAVPATRVPATDHPLSLGLRHQIYPH